MPAKKYRVTLTAAERETLQAVVRTGKGAARRLTRARILLLADEDQPEGGRKDTAIAAALGVHTRTVERTRAKCVELGLDAALNHKRPWRSRSKVLDGAAEARLAQIACTAAPDGHARWSMQMLADKLIALEVVESVSRETVRTTLKKTSSSRG